MKIPEIPLIPDPQTPEARDAVGFKWNAEAGKRHKLGGEPDWVQKTEHPRCTSCGATMTFYGQLDSIGDEHTIADVGLIFVFLCFGCFQSKAIVQSS